MSQTNVNLLFINGINVGKDKSRPITLPKKILNFLAYFSAVGFTAVLVGTRTFFVTLNIVFQKETIMVYKYFLLGNSIHDNYLEDVKSNLSIHL